MKKTKAATLSLLALTALVSCGGSGDSISSSGSVKTEIVDMAGRKVEIDLNHADKIVCIGAGALRLYTYINGSSLLAGVENIDNPGKNSEVNKQFASSPRPYYMVYGDSLEKLPSVGKGGPSNQAAEKELIAASGANLIISEYEDVDAANELQSATGIPVLTLKYDTANIFGEALYSSLIMIGQVTKKETRALDLVTYIQGEVANLSSKTKDVKDEDKKSVYLGCLGNWGVQDIFMTAKNYPLFNVTGIKNSVDSVLATSGFQNIDQEKFFTLDPDIIILDASGISKFKTTYNSALKSSFDSLKAFKSGDVYLQMPYNNYYTNIETALMDAYYDASIAFPDLYPDLDIAKKSNEISKTFLGKEIYSDMAGLANSYGGFQKIEISSFLSL